MNKITVVGAGNVGSTVAYSLFLTGLASEIVLVDINEKKALGEALDIHQGFSMEAPCSVYAGSWRDAAGSDIVIITSGLARKPGQSRLDLAQTNVNVIKSIAENIIPFAPEANYIIVSNPVDILTYTFCKISGLPESRVIGSGTILDTARLKSRLSDYYKINQSNVHAYVLGEHGDSSFIPWSLVNISNVSMEQFSHSTDDQGFRYPKPDLSQIENYVHKSGARVIERKGATFYAVSTAVCRICKSILYGIDTTMTVSTMMHGEYGIDDVCLSVLNIVGHQGAHKKILLPLTDEEAEKLRASAKALKEVMHSLDI